VWVLLLNPLNQNFLYVAIGELRVAVAGKRNTVFQEMLLVFFGREPNIVKSEPVEFRDMVETITKPLIEPVMEQGHGVALLNEPHEVISELRFLCSRVPLGWSELVSRECFHENNISLFLGIVNRFFQVVVINEGIIFGVLNVADNKLPRRF